MPPRSAKSPSPSFRSATRRPALTLAGRRATSMQRLVDAAPDDVRYVHDLAYTDESIGDISSARATSTAQKPLRTRAGASIDGGDRARQGRPAAARRPVALSSRTSAR